MDLLSQINYTRFNDFSISVEKIKYGWMDICLANNGKSLSYSVSYICDPINDLLETAVAIIKK